jgi:serine phosphatase RsbU (regulator of sigma subunit)/anti-sigma regulatory factor (Ser/Thr protein kinase)
MTETATQATRGVTLRQTLVCALAEVRRATRTARDFLAEQGVQEEEIIACELALAEACNNAVQYASEQGRQQLIVVTVTCNGSKVELQVNDHTPGFTWPARVSLPATNSERGRGLYIIQSLMDESAYLRGHGENSLVMRKTRCYQGYRHTHSVPPTREAVYQKLVESERTISEMARELCFRSETLSAIFHWSAELGRTNDLKDFAQRLLTDLLHISSMEWFVLRVVPPNESVLTTLAASEPQLYLPSVPISPGEPGQKSVEVEAAATRRDIWFDRARPRHARDPLNGIKPDAQGLVRPYFLGETLIGTLTVGRSAAQPQLTAAQAGVVHTFADFMAVEIVNLRLQEDKVSTRVMSRELEIAHNIQRALLPRTLPQLRHFGLAGFYESARQVGGDFYDVISLGPQSLLLLIADVMGKGVPAALFASILRSLVRAMTEHARTPGELLARVNQQMFDDLSRVDMFITAQLIHVDLRKRQLTMANAGHCPALLATADRMEVRTIAPEGMPIGVMAESRFVEETVRLSEHARLMLYTDGLTETRNPDGEQFGQRRLMNWLGKTVKRSDPAGKLKDELVTELASFHGPTPLRDDQSFLLLVESEEKGRPLREASGFQTSTMVQST